MEITGTIETLEMAIAKNDKPYKKISVNGKKFTIMEFKSFYKIAELGKFVKIDYEYDGKYNQISNLELATPTPAAVQHGHDTQRFSARQSALIRAVETLSGNIDVKNVIAIANIYETYMMGEKELPGIIGEIEKQFKIENKFEHKGFLDDCDELRKQIEFIHGNDSKFNDVFANHKYTNPHQTDPKDYKLILAELQNIAYPDDESPKPEPDTPKTPINQTTQNDIDVQNRMAIETILNCNYFTEKEITKGIEKAYKLKGEMLEKYKYNIKADKEKRAKDRAEGLGKEGTLPF